MTIIEALKESQHMLSEIPVPVRYLETITAPIRTVANNLGVIITAMENANIEHKDAAQPEEQADAIQPGDDDAE